MGVFPKTESGVSELASNMLSGLDEHADLFPSVSEATTTALNTAMNTYTDARNAQSEAHAAAKNATIAKNQKQDELEEEMRKVIYLAEHDCMNDPGNLDYIGWSTAGIRPPLPNQISPASCPLPTKGPARSL